MSLISLLFVTISPDYLDSTLHGERCELRHNHVHTFQAGSTKFEYLLFDYRLECQVRGEETRSERGPRGSKSECVEAVKERQTDIEKRGEKREEKVCSISDLKAEKSSQ